MFAHRRARTWLIWLAATLLPATAFAQNPPGDPREGFGVAVVFTSQSRVGRVLSVRVTQPAHEKIAFDFDIGWILPGWKRGRSQSPLEWHASGLVGGARMRWRPKGRSETGWSGAVNTGAKIMHSGTYDKNSQRTAHAWVIVPDFVGFTVDKLSDGYRIGGAAGGIASVPFELFTRRLDLKRTYNSNFPMVYYELFGAWVEK